MGGPVVALRGDHRAGRQGPLDRRRLARPERRHRPRGVRARAAAQRPVRVPQHRRQEDVDLQGPRRRRAHDRRGHPAGAAPVPVPPAAPEPGDRVRSGRDRRDPAPLRRVRQVRRGDGRPRGQGRDPPGYEATFRYSLLDPNADVAAEAAAFRPAFAHLALLVQIPGVDVAARVEAEKGSAADRARDARSSTSASTAAPRLARDLRARDGAVVAVQRTRCRRTPRRTRRRTASLPRAPLADRGRDAARRSGGDAVAER